MMVTFGEMLMNNTKTKLYITGVSDPMMWYRDKVNQMVELVKEYDDCYMAREDAGYINVVRKCDAHVVHEISIEDFTQPVTFKTEIDNKKDEYLNILQEECAEVIQSVSKIKRFGWTDKNIENLQTEVGDLLCMLDMLKQYAPEIASADFNELKKKKINKLQTFSSLI